MKKQKPWSTNKSMSFQLFKKKKQTQLNFFQYVIEPISHDLEKLVCFFFFFKQIYFWTWGTVFVIFPVMSGIKPKDTVLYFSIKRTTSSWCFITYMFRKGRFPRWLSGKEPAWQCRRHKRHKFDPGSQRSSGGGHGNPLQYSCLENPSDGGPWWPAVCGVAQSRTRLKRLSSSSRSDLGHMAGKECLGNRRAGSIPWGTEPWQPRM